MNAALRAEMLVAVPNLRAFAISLTRNVDRADDLVQEALTRALTHADKFQPGTNMQAWLFTILRNLFLSQVRCAGREVEDVDGAIAASLSQPPSQHAHLDVADLWQALGRLTVLQREALLLVGAEGLSYEEAARITCTEVGTVKSRVNRARSHLAALLGRERSAALGSKHPVAERSGIGCSRARNTRSPGRSA